MISLILLFLLLSSGGVVGGTIFKKKYEELLPVTCSIIVLILFLCGILGFMKAGVYLVYGLSLGAYGVAVWWMIKNKNTKVIKENIFTTGFFVFIFFFFMFAFLNRGKLVDGWDEFSHWADIVKVMTTLDDFGTNPNGHVYCQSYPPGMSLFQYFVQKVTILFNPVAGFSEWRLYFSYQIFFISFMVPFFKELNLKRKGILVTAVIAIFLCPLLFFADVYDKTYIDPFLGLLSGTGLAAIFLCEERDLLYSLRILLTCSMLVLAKDAGMLFAVFLGVGYVLDMVFSQKNILGGQRRRNIDWLIVAAASVISVILPKLLWAFHTKIRKANNPFSNPIDFTQLINIIIGRDDTYRTDVWKNFYRVLITTGNTIGNTGIVLNYLVLFVVFLLLFCGLIYIYKTNSDNHSLKGRCLIGVICIQTVVYTVGLCITYIFKFDEYDATRYASFTRYMNIAFLAEWIVIVLLSIGLIQRYVKVQHFGCVTILCIMVLVSPLEFAYDFFQKTSVENSVELRAQYDPLITQINAVANGSYKINVISQESNGFDYLVMTFGVRPNVVVSPYSIGEPFYEGDMWTTEMTAAQWQEQLVNGVDFVALYRINDYFVEYYGGLFENPAEIGANMVYQVNKKTGLLERCK